MNPQQPSTCIAFEGSRLIASGPLAEVAVKAKELSDRADHGTLLVFDEHSSEPIEIDFRGTVEEVRDRFQPPRRSIPSAGEPSRDTSRGPGRPKLGVIAREVTLLPRHWEWLNAQPGGPSVTLRRLVEETKRANFEHDRIRVAKEAAYRFMSAMAGDLPGFEEATRALFSKKGDRVAEFEKLVAPWPNDVRDHAIKLMRATVPMEDALPGELGAGQSGG